MKIFFAILFGFSFVHANPACSMDKLQNNYKLSKLQDQIDLENLIADPQSSPAAINQAINRYYDKYRDYPELFDRKRGGAVEGRLVKVNDDGEWVLRSPEDQLIGERQGTKKYGLKENPQLDTTITPEGLVIHKPKELLRGIGGKPSRLYSVDAEDLGISTHDKVLVGLSDQGHAYLMVNGQRMDTWGLLNGYTYDKSRHSYVSRGLVYEIKNLSSQQKQGIKDYLKKMETESIGSPKLAALKRKDCVHSVCKALKEGGGVDIKAPLFQNAMMDYMTKNHLIDKSGKELPIEIYFTRPTDDLQKYQRRMANVHQAEMQPIKEITKTVALGGAGVAVAGAFVVYIGKKMFVVSEEEMEKFLSEYK